MDDFAHGRNTTPLPARLPAFDWETRVVDLFPVELGWSIQELADGDNWAAQRATLRDLLTHVSGLPGHDYAYKTGDTAEDIVWRMGGLRAAYELRTKASYNNQVRPPPTAVAHIPTPHTPFRPSHASGSHAHRCTCSARSSSRATRACPTPTSCARAS